VKLKLLNVKERINGGPNKIHAFLGYEQNKYLEVANQERNNSKY
jgi:hypothetical protein